MNTYRAYIRSFILAMVFALASIVIAVPAPARAATKLSAPDLYQASSNVGYVGLAWSLDYDDTGDSRISPDEELIDYFNVYCDGRLVVRVDVSAVFEDVSWYDSSRSHHWYFAYDPGDRWALHNFQVSSVAKDGTESPLSETRSAEAKSDGVEIVSHQASDGNNSIGLEFKLLGDYSLSRFDLWRSQGKTPPDTSKAPYAVISTNRRPEATSWDYWDKDVSADGNYTYTYTVRATDSQGTESNFYTFTVIHSSGGDNPSLNPPYVDYELVNNTTPTLTFTAYNWESSGYPTTYKFYRNDAQMGSFKGTGSHSFSDTPTADGTYTYRVDMEVAGFTVRGRDYTFTRNTKPVDLLSKPDAPALVGRLDSQHMVMLAWTPAATGGEVEGYHIYRKDAGAFVEGSYRRSGYFYVRGLNRYLDVSADTTAFTDIGIPGATDAYLGNYELGRLTEVWWGDTNAPHEYYVTAYNDYGESAPSNVITFPYANDDYPLNGDTVAPGAPTITKAWVEWEDDSNSNSYVSEGAFDENPGYYIHVAWDEPKDAATTVGSYRATFDDGGDYVYDDSVPRYGLLNGLHVQDGMSEYSPLHHVYAGDEDDFNKSFTVIMYAENEAGATASEPVKVQVDGPPRIQVVYDNGTAVVRWADPVFSTATVTGWELYRRPEHGLVAKVGTFGPNVHEYVDTDVLDGWTYDYYVVAKTSAGDRRSVWASRLISKGDGLGEKVSAPTNLKATVINGRLVLSWDRPADESIYVSFYIAEFKYPGSDEWVTSPYASAQGGYEGMTLDDVSDLVDKDMQVRVYSESYGGGGESERSEPVSFKITSAQAAAHVEGRPGTVMISGEAGEGQCKITWSTSADTNKPPATEYRIKRYDTEYGIYGDYATIGTVAAKGEGSYDYEYVDRYAENGKTYRYMVYPANSDTEALVDSNYDYVELSPTAKTHDQQVAEMVAELIAALPEPANVTAGDAERISDVADIWDGLSKDQQELVKDIDKKLPKKLSDDVAALEDLELLERYAELVAPVQAKIDALPDEGDVTESNRGAIEAARAAYDGISPTEAKRLVKTERLVAAERALASLADREAAAAVATQIEALPDAGKLTLDDAEKVEAARAALNALSAAQRAYVDAGLVERLSSLEDRIAELRQEADDREAAEAVEAKIQALPDAGELTLDDEGDVRAARKALDALSKAQSTYVDAGLVEKLFGLEARIAELREAAGLGSWKRLAGANRFETMAAIVAEGFDASDTAVLASGANFPDALVASAVAGELGCPVVLTWPDSLSAEAAESLKALGTRSVWVMGSNKTITDGVLAEVEALGIQHDNIQRIAGTDRQATSLEAMRWLDERGAYDGTVVIASGFSFPDALAIGPWCFGDRVPILLADKNGRLSDDQYDALEGGGLTSGTKATTVVILGGTDRVTNGTRAKIAEACGIDPEDGDCFVELAGSDRYETAALIAGWEITARGMGLANVTVATGQKFPDALAGAPLCGSRNSVLVLARDKGSAGLSLIDGNAGVRTGYVLGDANAVSNGLFSYLESLTS